jgi:anion-transporting  ArsA/GET3 family ATPase
VILRGDEAAQFDALGDAGIVVVCGPGGVGKTTMAASIAARAAATRPMKVLVLTVDPARRLATALGLDGLGDRETPVPAESYASVSAVAASPAVSPIASPVVSPAGTLHAAMIDTNASWDDLVRRHAPDAATRDRVLANPLYRNLTERFTASHDYVAMERLFEARRSGGYDLVVVDTPPSRNALDVLDAPERMRAFFASRLLRALTVGSRGGLAALASRPIVEVARRILGVRFLDDVTEFFDLLRTMEDGFVARAADVATMLRAPDARFAVVTTVEEPALGDATRLADELRARSYPLAAIVANRVLPAHLTPESLTAAADALSANTLGIAASALASAATAARDAAALADAQRVALTALRAHAPQLLLTTVSPPGK